MKNIVTGAAGFIGSKLTERLLEKGEDVVGIDNFHNYYSRKIKENNIEQIKKKSDKVEGSFKLIEGSILNDKHLQRLPENPKKVYHKAAIAGARNSITDPHPYTKINVAGTSKLLKNINNPEKFILTSSSSVYGEISKQELPVKETRRPNPTNPYSLSKKHAENLTEMYSRLYGIEHVIIRPFTVYGPRQRPDELFTKFIKQVLENKPVTIYGDGNQTRDFTHVDDVVRGTLMAAKKGNGIYNIGTGRRITVNNVVDAMENVLERDIERKYLDKSEADVRHTHADITKARKELGYEPEKSFDQGTQECVSWVKQMKKGVL